MLTGRQIDHEAGAYPEGQLALGMLRLLGGIGKVRVQRCLEVVHRRDIVGGGLGVRVFGSPAAGELDGAMGPDAIGGVCRWRHCRRRGALHRPDGVDGGRGLERFLLVEARGENREDGKVEVDPEAFQERTATCGPWLYPSPPRPFILRESNHLIMLHYIHHFVSACSLVLLNP